MSFLNYAFNQHKNGGIIMKRQVVLFTGILFCLSLSARDPGGTWVMTGKDRMDCSKIRLGYNKARLVLENGQKTVVAFNAIISFSQDGRIFTKLPVYREGKPTRQMAFMELIKTVGDLSLYRLRTLEMTSPDLRQETNSYFLYQGKKLHLALDEKSTPNVCKYFGLDAAEL